MFFTTGRDIHVLIAAKRFLERIFIAILMIARRVTLRRLCVIAASETVLRQLQSFLKMSMCTSTIIQTAPTGSIYQNRIKFNLSFPSNYPFKLPMLKFISKVYHPRIRTETGETCIQAYSLMNGFQVKKLQLSKYVTKNGPFTTSLSSFLSFQCS